MVCIQCGKENDEDANFCKNCGAPMAVTGPGSPNPASSQGRRLVIHKVYRVNLGVIFKFLAAVSILTAAALYILPYFQGR